MDAGGMLWGTRAQRMNEVDLGIYTTRRGEETERGGRGRESKVSQVLPSTQLHPYIPPN